MKKPEPWNPWYPVDVWILNTADDSFSKISLGDKTLPFVVLPTSEVLFVWEVPFCWCGSGGRPLLENEPGREDGLETG